ncbi:hypothetical protein BHE18_00360 [Rossellomorea aquimaris]|uniref:Uncharacterized protein n=1 Tax=Rossellomorea aquimaris TaxID=189382 RepID=A0A1J6X4G3_9BACI|nr:hypothetical protein BHE18_00360 [Rossellomorea aquimaris]
MVWEPAVCVVTGAGIVGGVGAGGWHWAGVPFRAEVLRLYLAGKGGGCLFWLGLGLGWRW